MIEYLRIRDFALVDDLTVEPGPGLNVITGETGAGKSILLNALGLLLGDRASRESVRAGAERALVEGLFRPEGAAREAIAGFLGEAGVAWEEGDELTISRTVAADGRSRAYVNGSLAPLGLVARIGEALAEFSGQHQHQSLLREELHLTLLDAALDASGRAARAGYATAHAAWAEAEAALVRLQRLEGEARERTEFLRFQRDEIAAAGLRPDEDVALREERELLANAGKLLELYADAEGAIYSESEAALDRTVRALRLVEGAVARDGRAAPVVELLNEARGCLEEAALQLRERRDALESDPGRLEALEERLETIRRLERKHGKGAEAILAALERIEQDLWELENTELALEKAAKARAGAAAALVRAATDLSAARALAARELERRVGAELRHLALGSGAFQVSMEPCEPGPDGAEAVRFLLAANPGEPPRPLARVASGGELSRILLALKNALRDRRVGTLVFDEVDAGIGGATADAVGERLAQLAADCQVLCITHLPQIAPRGVHHLRVEKHTENGRTVTRVSRLQGEQRVEEIARMLGGQQVTATTRQHARELLERFSR